MGVLLALLKSGTTVAMGILAALQFDNPCEFGFCVGEARKVGDDEAGDVEKETLRLAFACVLSARPSTACSISS